jgi:hypothetical protein
VDSAADSKFIGALRSFTYLQFVQTCVVAGCDYCASLPGVALKTAAKLVAQVRECFFFFFEFMFLQVFLILHACVFFRVFSSFFNCGPCSKSPIFSAFATSTHCRSAASSRR